MTTLSSSSSESAGWKDAGLIAKEFPFSCLFPLVVSNLLFPVSTVPKELLNFICSPLHRPSFVDWLTEVPSLLNFLENSFSISSNVLPFVSGTKKYTKTRPAMVQHIKNQKAPYFPKPICIGGKLLTTVKVQSRLKLEEIEPKMDR